MREIARKGLLKGARGNPIKDTAGVRRTVLRFIPELQKTQGKHGLEYRVSDKQLSDLNKRS